MFQRCDTYEERKALFDAEPSIHSSDIVMLGDSLTCFGGDWARRLGISDVPVFNRGIAGDDLPGIRDRLDQIVPYHPALVVFLAGVNDISHGCSAQEIAEGIFDVVNRFRRNSPGTKLILQSLLPINESFHQWRLLEGKTGIVPEVNRLIADKASSEHITYLDLFPHFVIPDTPVMRPELTVDGLHLTEAGYNIWGSLLRKVIAKSIST